MQKRRSDTPNNVLRATTFNRYVECRPKSSVSTQYCPVTEPVTSGQVYDLLLGGLITLTKLELTTSSKRAWTIGCRFTPPQLRLNCAVYRATAPRLVSGPLAGSEY